MKAERLVVGLRQGIGIAWRFAAAILASFVVAFVVFTLILAGPAWSARAEVVNRTSSLGESYPSPSTAACRAC